MGIHREKTESMVEKEGRGGVVMTEEKGSVLGARGGGCSHCLSGEPTCFKFIAPGVPSDFV